MLVLIFCDCLFGWGEARGGNSLSSNQKSIGNCSLEISQISDDDEKNLANHGENFMNENGKNEHKIGEEKKMSIKIISHNVELCLYRNRLRIHFFSCDVRRRKKNQNHMFSNFLNPLSFPSLLYPSSTVNKKHVTGDGLNTKKKENWPKVLNRFKNNLRFLTETFLKKIFDF